MAVMMLMQWDNVTRDQYEAVRKTVDWEGNVPRGALFHVAAFDDKGLKVTDVWERAEDFQAFADQRLMAATQKAGISGQPKVQFLPVHAIFAPAYATATH